MVRLRNCFMLGVQKLRDVLTLPGENVGWKLEKFFNVSLERNGKGQRQDVEEPVVAFGTGAADYSQLKGDFDRYRNNLIYGKWFHGESLHNWLPPSLDTTSWANISFYMSRVRNGFNGRNQEGPTSMPNIKQSPNNRRSNGTGTYIPGMVHSPFTLSLIFLFWKRSCFSKCIDPSVSFAE